MTDQTALLQAMAEALRECHSPVIYDPDCKICQLLARCDAQVRASGAQADVPAWAWRQAINRYGINAEEIEQRAAELSSKG